MLLAARHRPNAALQVLSQVIACADPREGRVRRHHVLSMHSRGPGWMHRYPGWMHRGVCVIVSFSTGCASCVCSCILCMAVRIAA